MKKFKRIYVEITNICNLSCEFCPKLSRKRKFMDEKEFEIILKKIRPHTDYIYLHLMGEPLLNPNLELFLSLANSYGFKVNITTNGTLIHKAKDILLNAEALRQVNISLHSFEANDNDIDFHEYFDNVLSFIDEARKNTNIITAMRLWNLDSSNTIGANKLNDSIIDKITDKFGYDGYIIEELKKKPRIKLGDNLYLNSAEKFNWPDINIEPLGDIGFCHGLRDHIGILSNGTVVPCCLDSEGNIHLGNIFDKSLEEIINDKRARDIYNGFSGRKRVEELCKRCGYSERFNILKMKK